MVFIIKITLRTLLRSNHTISLILFALFEYSVKTKGWEIVMIYYSILFKEAG